MTGPDHTTGTAEPAAGSGSATVEAAPASADNESVEVGADGAPASADDESVDVGAGRVDRSRLALYASAGALLLLLVAAVLLGLQLRSSAQDEAAREAALSAARQSAVNLTSIGQEDFEQDVADVLDGASGQFRSDFAARADDLERLLIENEVVADGEVLEAAIVRADRRSATALVVIDSTVRNSATPEGRVNSYRMKLELERVGGRWLTTMLEFVG